MFVHPGLYWIAAVAAVAAIAFAAAAPRVQGATLRGHLDPARAASVENAVRSELAEKSGHLRSVLLTRAPGVPIPIGLRLRHGHLDGTNGFEVEAVEPAGAGASAGFQAGDIITHPASPGEFQKKMSAAAFSGQPLTVTVRRQGTKLVQLVVHPKLDIEDFGLTLAQTKHSSRGKTCSVFKIADIEPGSIAGNVEPHLNKGDSLIGVNGIPLSLQHSEALRRLDTAGRVMLSVFSADEFECPVRSEEVPKQPQKISAAKNLPPSEELTKLLVLEKLM